MFIYAPALAAQGSYAEISLAVVTSLAGVVVLSAGMQGYLLRKANFVERLILIGGGLCMILPGSVTDLVGAGFAGSVIVLQFISKKRAKAQHS